MSLSLVKIKGRRETHSFFAFPKHILNSKEYNQLSGWSVKLLLDMAGQFNGVNNGDLCSAWTIMKEKGWNSKDTLWRAQNNLEKNGWIFRTRQGGRNKANLYALSWLPIDECQGKLDVRPTRTAPNTWKKQIE